MPLKIVTLTGVDDHTPIDGLRGLSNDYPFVEFGVLLDYKFQGKNARYPSLKKIDEIVKAQSRHRLPLALHLCGGTAIEEFLANADSMTAYLARQFDRVQLNYDPMSELSLRELGRAMARFPNQTIITQHGDNLPRTHWRSITAPNHAVLFDNSQGTGRLPGVWPEPLLGKPCGYAGGLNPSNIEQQLESIHDAATAMGAADPEPCYWTDAESGVQDGTGRFSLTLCRDFARKVERSGFMVLRR